MSSIADLAIVRAAGSAGLARRVWPWRRQSAVDCEQVGTVLPAILDGDVAPSPELVDHVEYCLHCQAELARYRKLLRLLHQLRQGEVVVPPGVVADVLSSLEQAANRRAIRSLLAGRQLAYGAAVLAAVGAGASLLVVALWRSRSAAASNGEGLRSGEHARL
jgi:predicted anti-sigma-YlaC factor YlaD